MEERARRLLPRKLAEEVGKLAYLGGSAPPASLRERRRVGDKGPFEVRQSYTPIRARAKRRKVLGRLPPERIHKEQGHPTIFSATSPQAEYMCLLTSIPHPHPHCLSPGSPASLPPSRKNFAPRASKKKNAPSPFRVREPAPRPPFGVPSDTHLLEAW